VAVKQNGLNIGYMENPTDRVKIEAIKENNRAILHIENPTDEMKMEYIKKCNINYFNDYYLEDLNITEEMKMEAVKKEKIRAELEGDESKILKIMFLKKIRNGVVIY